MSIVYSELIPENIAYSNINKICIERDGRTVGYLDLGHLQFPQNIGTKQYSFGAISDVHIDIDTAQSDFTNALNYFSEMNVDFVCIAGDLTNSAETAQWTNYKSIVDASGLTVYPIGGNHDAFGSGLSDATFRQYTGYGTYYTIDKGNDVFAMISQAAWASQSGGIQPFYTTGLQALQSTLETNRNKRVFVFMHPFIWGKAGDPFELYSSNALWGTQGTLIRGLMSHYTNSIWFHGHSHETFETQKFSVKANYDKDLGAHSIHIPSITKPVYVDGTSRVDKIDGSEGYIVDVYPNAIHLIGRDFITDKDYPMSSYLLDTTLHNIEPNTFIDESGILS